VHVGVSFAALLDASRLTYAVLAAIAGLVKTKYGSMLPEVIRD
jgi:hypothetical protein